MTDTIVTVIETMTEGDPNRVPLYASQPAAGFPAPADDQVEQNLNIHDLVVKNPTSTFFVRVSGDSMEGAMIFAGDVLVVDRSIKVTDGKVVVAAVYGELVVKYVYQQGDTIELRSANEEYEPIVVSGEDCYIWGSVVGSVRQF